MTTEELKDQNQENLNKLHQAGLPIPIIVILKERLDFITEYITGKLGLDEDDIAQEWEVHFAEFLQPMLDEVNKAILLAGVPTMGVPASTPTLVKP